MSRMLGAKIGISASVIPALALAWALACHYRPKPQQHPDQQQQNEPVAGNVTKKQISVRKYTTAKGYWSIYIFTDPEKPDQHCIATESANADYSCYPNVPGLKIGNGGPLDLRHYEAPKGVGDILMFDDPENPDFHCLSNQESSYTCYPKSRPQPK